MEELRGRLGGGKVKRHSVFVGGPRKGKTQLLRRAIGSRKRECASLLAPRAAGELIARAYQARRLSCSVLDWPGLERGETRGVAR